jgi:hypothetical protein
LRAHPTTCRLHQTADQRGSVLTAEQRPHAALGVRHHPEHVALHIDQPGDRVQSTVRVGAIVQLTGRRAVAKRRHALCLHLAHDIRVGEPVPLLVRNRQPKHLTTGEVPEKREVVPLHPQVHVAADETQRAVHQHRTGQKPNLEQHLKAVADTEHRPTVGGVATHGGHHGRVGRHRPSSQVVAV